jgi:hypothetical protein
MEVHMRNNSRFQRGSGVFTCTCCGGRTRDTGVQSIGSELCADCYELAGMDNACNDNRTTPEQEGYTKEIEQRLAKITKRGGNVERVKAMNDYLFPTP